jgi:hypothetical protein
MGGAAGDDAGIFFCIDTYINEKGDRIEEKHS